MGDEAMVVSPGAVDELVVVLTAEERMAAAADVVGTSWEWSVASLAEGSTVVAETWAGGLVAAVVGGMEVVMGTVGEVKQANSAVATAAALEAPWVAAVVAASVAAERVAGAGRVAAEREGTTVREAEAMDAEGRYTGCSRRNCSSSYT